MVAELAEPWDDAEAEYTVLTSLVSPAVQADFQRSLQDWNALEGKALGLLGLDAALIAGLFAAHDAINRLWWLAAVVAALGGGFFIASVWPRDANLGPDWVEFHDALRAGDRLEAARTLVNEFIEAVSENDGAVASKVADYERGLALLALALVISLPVVLFRP